MVIMQVPSAPMVFVLQDDQVVRFVLLCSINWLPDVPVAVNIKSPLVMQLPVKCVETSLKVTVIEVIAFTLFNVKTAPPVWASALFTNH